MSQSKSRPSDWRADIGTTYDKIAEHYAAEYFDELSRKPFDCELLTRFARSLPANARVCDIGCGPGHIAQYLASHGLDMTGADLSPAMIATARRLNPSLRFVPGDMLHLPFDDQWFAGITAFYSLIQIERPLLPHALAEFYRVLTPQGRLLVAFHAGQGEIHRDEWYGEAVAVHLTLFSTDEMTKAMENAGFRIDQVLERDPYQFEYQSRRAFISALRSSGL